MSILTSSAKFSNAQIQLAGASIAGNKISALLRRGTQTRLIDASSIDLSNFSRRGRRRAWRQASRVRHRRQPAIRPGAAA